MSDWPLPLGLGKDLISAPRCGQAGSVQAGSLFGIDGGCEAKTGSV